MPRTMPFTSVSDVAVRLEAAGYL
ncbi:MAG: hypothetical protein JWP10_1505, partial [Nocardioidaceae bacterium]|nr:hypothetical protein [Nocardioidaceae bacterium]